MLERVIEPFLSVTVAPTVAGARRLSAVAAGFDADGYRILVGPVLTGALEVLAL